jgi:hypothetical protein
VKNALQDSIQTSWTQRTANSVKTTQLLARAPLLSVIVSLFVAQAQKEAQQPPVKNALQDSIQT